jgi:hypothetical protein
VPLLAALGFRMSTPWEGKTGTVYAKKECDVCLEEVLACLGEEHYIETDPSRTHSGIERFWIFDAGNGLALAFQYLDPIGKLFIGINQEGNIHPKLLQRFISFPTKATTGVMWQ